ncbi:SOS response-associated peptidase [Alicyclobacillus sp. ALC3]|uniref:SOS response-associated peptidase n=1 Tax=Alicyclobacillus sp. ALC3 TaxID=2796143 RepID=UPI00237869C2|nr:SOS response-associated peptidase [Alicyclobacillus sp. ALC3]WDL97894.1 SOS response-associated peptidase [Alicyclobacillus sp. ALC3]
MCGRFTQAFENWSSILEYFGISDNGFRLPPRYNIAPTQDVAAIISDGQQRRIGRLRWGLIPVWSESDKTTFATFNARADKLLANGMWKRLVPRKRCIIPADGFFEWRKIDKQPFRMVPTGRPAFGFAGLYDTWTSPDGAMKVGSCAIITCQPNLLMISIHDRMPVILREEVHDLWLDRGVMDPHLVTSILQPYPDREMWAYRVAKMVGNVRNDGPECIKEVH